MRCAFADGRMTEGRGHHPVDAVSIPSPAG